MEGLGVSLFSLGKFTMLGAVERRETRSTNRQTAFIMERRKNCKRCRSHASSTSLDDDVRVPRDRVTS